jgi:hypothetical protein
MSWKQAQADAERWLDLTGLTREQIRDQLVDMRPFVGLMEPHEGQYRTMVLGAMKRVLKARGASGCLLPE